LLVWEKRKTNLYEIWDHYVLVNTLNQVYDSTADGTVVDWCNESHVIAQRIAYRELPAVGGAVSEDYVRKARSTATDQLAKAAARLAALLNDTLNGSP
jgi:hypothetical protein